MALTQTAEIQNKLKAALPAPAGPASQLRTWDVQKKTEDMRKKVEEILHQLGFQ